MDCGVESDLIINVKLYSTIVEDEKTPLIELVKPLLFAPVTRNHYTLGEEMGMAFSKEKVLGGEWKD